MQLDALLRGEVLLLELELRSQIEEAEFLFLFRDHLIEKRQVVAEEQNACGIVHLSIFTDIALKENCGHRGDVFMAEAQISAGKTSIAGLDRPWDLWSRAMLRCTGADARTYLGIQHVARKNLLRQRHGAPSRFDRRKKNLFLHARHVEGEEATIFDHLLSDLILTRGEFSEWDLFSRPDLVDQREVGRGQQAQVLAILFVNALNVLGNDQSDPSAHLGVRRLLPAGPFAASFAADRADEPAPLDLTPPNRKHIAAFEAQVGNFTERLIEIETVMRRGDLIGRDGVPQLGIAVRAFGIPGQVFPCELAPDEFWVFRQE